MSESHDSVWANRGRPPEDRRPVKAPRRVRLALAVAVVLLAALVVAVVVSSRDDVERNRRTAAAEQARLEAAERVRLRREGRPVRFGGPPRRAGEGPLDHRERLVTAGEERIEADAIARFRRGEQDRRANGVECQPFPRTETRRRQEADPALPVNRYQCIAFTRRFPLSELNGQRRYGLIGQPYWLIVDYHSARETFCKVTPRAGEGGKSLAVVPVAVPCREPLAARSG